MKLMFLILLTGALTSACMKSTADINNQWLTPAEFEATAYSGALDCEDFAFYKFFVLEKAGLDPVVVQGTKDDFSHMWVEAEGKVYDIFEPGKLEPIIYFNRTCYWLAGKDGSCGDATHIVKWNQYLNGQK